MRSLVMVACMTVACAGLACDRKADSRAPAGAARPAVDPVVASADRSLDKCRAYIDAGKFDEADAILLDLRPVLDKLSEDQRSRASFYSIRSGAGRKAQRESQK